mgnify:CR=1 FL=1
MIKPEYLSEKIRKFAYKYPIYVFYSSIRKISKTELVIKKEIKVSFSRKNANKQIYLLNSSSPYAVMNLIYITQKHEFDYKNIRC